MKLYRAIGTTDANITLLLPDAVNGPGVIQIGSEKIHFQSTDGQTFFGCSRGYASTSAATHAAGTAVTSVSTDDPVGDGDLTGTAPVVVTGGTATLVGNSAAVSMPVASDSVDGYLSHADHASWVKKAGDTMTGALTITTASSNHLLLNAGAGAVDINVDTAGDLIVSSNKAHAVVSFIPSTTGNATWFQEDGSITVNSTTNVPSAVLTATDTARGFLPPRMTTTQKNAISSPAEGLMVYDASLHKLCVYTGSAWETVTSA